MTQRDQERFMEETRELFTELRNGIIGVINGITEPEHLTPILKKWYAKRQPLNNQNIGILIGFHHLAIIDFPITGDPKLDSGQKALPHSPEITEGETRSDKEFLKKIGIIFESEPQ